MDLIEFGRKHRIHECCKEGFRMLAFRVQPLSCEEGERLGMSTVIAVADARDALAKGTRWSDLEVEFKLENGE